MKGLRVLVCGDREWNDLAAIELTLSHLGPNDTVITGAARGADQLAIFAATHLGCKIEDYPAKWKEKGKAAGPIRNQQMLDEGKPDLVIAFHDDLANSKGTLDMVVRARKAGVRIFLVEHDDNGGISIGYDGPTLFDLAENDPVLKEIRDILL